MRLGAPRHDAQTARGQRVRQYRRILDHLLLIGLEVRRQRFLEGDRLGGDHMHQRAALQPGKDRRIDRLLMLGLHQDDAAARTAQALVGGRRDHIGMRDRIRVDAGGDQAGVMRHVDHESGARVAGNLREAREIDPQAVGRGASDDDARLVLMREPFHLVVVDLLGLVQAVRLDVEPLARDVDRRSVGQMSAHRQRHAQNGVARLGHAHEHRLVGLRAGMRLHVDRFRAEQLLQALDRQGFGDVDIFTTTVVALARIALRVLVGHLAALRRHHGRTAVVFRGDQLDMFLLAAVLELDRAPQFRIDLFDGQ